MSRIEALSDRQTLEDLVRARVRHLQAGPLCTLLADLPFAGYMTTNYDSVIEGALSQIQGGWVSVGNTSSELPKLGGAAERVVWHIHGGEALDAARSHLVITEEDYDASYLQENPYLTQLRSLLLQRRMVFIGFGFGDPEFLRVLKIIGKLTSPARPVFAFLSNVDDEHLVDSRQDLLERFNVDVVSYRVIEDSHAELMDLLETYGSLVIKRSMGFGRPARSVPSYDPETTGLLLYNSLVLQRPTALPEEAFDSLLEARLLSSIDRSEGTPFSFLLEKLRSRLELLSGADPQRLENDLKETARSLTERGLIKEKDDRVLLTEAGVDRISEHAAIAELLGQQFASSIKARVALIVKDIESIDPITDAASAFLRHCIAERSLGIAMTWASWTTDQRQYQIVALLQALPSFMEALDNRGEGLALSRVIQDILANPEPAESRYIGAALQAQFGKHLLGYDRASLVERTRELKETCFLIDAKNLIPLVARSSWGHDAARRLVDLLQQIGAGLATTGLLTVEVSEHASWATKNFATVGALSVETLEAATGRGGRRSNAFVEGLLEELSQGLRQPDFLQYLGDVFGVPRGTNVTPHLAAERVGALGIAVRDLNEWEGFEESDWAEVEEFQQEIGKRRRAKDTFTHDRQVRAEAEALVVIRRVRANQYGLNGTAFSNAFFVSNTRILDDLDRAGLPITMRPEPLFHWIATLQPIELEELEVFTSSLLGELFQRGLDIVDPRELQTIFTPLVAASAENLAEEQERHRALLAQMYGEDGLRAFDELSPLETPVALQSVHRQRADALEGALESETQRRAKAESVTQLSEAEREELQKFRLRQQERRRKAERKRRSAKSRSRRRRRRRG